MPQSGILLINKPVDMRSTDCVQKVRHIFGRKTKIGHGGTLDSTASGLLVILVEQATRLSDFIMTMPKCYETEAVFGTATSTDDASGDIISESGWKHINDDQIDVSICGFLGWIMQSPPAVSAVHIGGMRAHKLARSGKAEIPKAKPVFVESIERISDLDVNGSVKFRIHCSKGTYIRSLVRDLGTALESCAHVKALKRLLCGPFDLSNAFNGAELDCVSAESLNERIIGMTDIGNLFSGYLADEKSFARLSHGQGTPLSELRHNGTKRNISMTGMNIVYSDKIFSLCSLSCEQGTFYLKPEVNIILDTGEKR